MLVKLKTTYVDDRGGRTYPGERINVDPDTGELLIDRGTAERVKVAPRHVAQAQEAAEQRAVEAVLDPSKLRGEAKRKYLIEQIKARGAVPDGTTIPKLYAQLRALEG